MPTLTVGKKIIESAFQPLLCGVEIVDFGRQFRFLVYEQDGQGIYKLKETPSNIMRKDHLLREILTTAREEIKGRGHALDPWEYPNAT